MYDDCIYRDSIRNLQSSADTRTGKEYQEMQEKLLLFCQNKETNGGPLLNEVGTTVRGVDKARMPSIPNLGTEAF